MIFTFMALFCLGLDLDLGTQVLAETLQKPTLRAYPLPVVTKGMQVVMTCEGTRGAQKYHLYKEGGPDPWFTQPPLESGNKAEFSFPSVEKYHAGRYHCYYQSPAGWSEHSDTLELVVTGLYEKPSLSLLSSPAVTSGGNVSFQCVSTQGYDGFVLTKEGQQAFSWTVESQYIYSNGHFRALFTVDSMILNQRWKFRCYGYHLSSPQVWSLPSDSLELLVPEASETISPLQNTSEAKTSTVFQPPNYTTGNLIRMSMAGLILLVLGILLFEAHHSRKRTQCAVRR